MTEAGLDALDGEQGSVTLWSLGLLLILFFAGAVALDLWRVVSYHGTLTSIADRAAIAGAAEVHVAALYRNSVELVPDRAAWAAEDFARFQPHWDDASMTVHAFADRSTVSVEVSGTIELTLLGKLAPPRVVVLNVRGQATPTVFE